jgi:hypothetical protein
MVGGSAAAASAATVHHAPQFRSAEGNTVLSQRDDSGGNGNWAKDYVNRELTIHLTGGNATTGYTYTAYVRDSGTFRTDAGAFTPNQGAPYTGEKITHQVSGPMSGHAAYSFTANKLPVTRHGRLELPSRIVGDGGSTSTWYELAFPSGATFGGTGIGAWSWTYNAQVKVNHHRVIHERWVDGSSLVNNAGQGATAGNID